MSQPTSFSLDQPYTEIIVVRHGETAWNATGRIQGHMDVELDEVGRQQAASLAERLSRVPEISAIYSSDLKRLLKLLRRLLQPVASLSSQSLSPGLPSIFVSPDRSSYTLCLQGGGESSDQLYHRATSSLQRICQRHTGKRVVVVTHGGVIRALYRRACSSRFRGIILNTSVNIFQISGDDVWTIKAWGDIDHLNQTGHSMSGFGVSKTPSVVSPVLT
ncbi:hypothetical protein ES319_A12G071800v1 [Gossypium barbadense]|uniref:Phosphoglycerate mutase-like protein 4 n=1 Tax=Gossypium barbadense TaxID=3634 RepID=A0A5J5T766_GOSBA|nr:hypothetical protein ES319_A12G071800v1 [Gossypium barbadense]